jgi:hypothetical protein
MRTTAWALCAAVALLTLTVAGCGGHAKKSYTYTFAASGKSPLTAGVYVSVTSPIPIPASAFKGGRAVDHPVGHRVCTITQTVEQAPPKYPQFKGKTLTLKIYGSTPIVKLICRLARQNVTQAFGR